MEKGILTKKEAKEIVIETKREMEKKNFKNDGEKREEAYPITKKIKFKGDIRLRYQWQDEDGKSSRNRERIRLRYGIIGKPYKNLEFGFGLASGGSDPRSTNVTLTGVFESKDIKLDYVYAKYTIRDTLSIWIGKYKGIKDTLWRTSDLLWDSDLRPEGIGLKFNHSAGKNFNFFSNYGFLILDERKDTRDATFFYIQPGVNVNLTENKGFKLSLAYYLTNSVKGHILPHSSNSNTLQNGVLKYDYDAISPDFEFYFKNLSKKIPYTSFFCNYVYNPDPSKNNKGYLLGFKLGDKSIKNSGNWQFKYMYRKLEKDAWLDIFPDSDAYGGRTNIKGHEVIFEYGIGENTLLGIDYYRLKKIEGKTTQNLLQLDWIIKF